MEKERAKKIIRSIKGPIKATELIEIIAEAMRANTKEVIKQIQNQAKDAPIKADWVGFNAYL